MCKHNNCLCVGLQSSTGMLLCVPQGNDNVFTLRYTNTTSTHTPLGPSVASTRDTSMIMLWRGHGVARQFACLRQSGPACTWQQGLEATLPCRLYHVDKSLRSLYFSYITCGLCKLTNLKIRLSDSSAMACTRLCSFSHAEGCQHVAVSWARAWCHTVNWVLLDSMTI